MRKFLVLAMVATLLTAGSAFAANRHFGAAPNATYTTAIGQGPTTTNNDDSCDISVAPAATLLLPYFEVDTTGNTGETTLFTITNTSNMPAIAHVVIWTEYSVPVLDFNIFLTGYDVQGINLRDIIVGGVVAPPSGTSNQTTEGDFSLDNVTGNPNFLSSAESTCSNLPGTLPGTVVTNMRNALTTGDWAACDGPAGGDHAGLAKGYVTVDVAATCSTKLPTDSTYFETEMLFDNVLIGDYQQLGATPVGGTAATGFDGMGNPMVHIRAIPEGGGVGITPTNLPFTFYDRYVATALADRRQPLPAVWAARYIDSSASADATLNFATNYKIWREGTDYVADEACPSGGTEIPIADLVRFDEHENPFTIGGSGVICSPCPGPSGPVLPEASLVASNDTTVFPANTANEDLGGWMYMNLDNTDYAGTTPNNTRSDTLTDQTQFASQNWVVVEMFGTPGGNRMAVDFDAAWLGNGCSPIVGVSEESNGATGTTGDGAVIGPAPNQTPYPIF